MKLQEFCVNHPTKKAVQHCKQCGQPLCSDCRLLLAEGTFCSDGCHREFLELRQNILDTRGPRRHFSFIALLKHLFLAAILIAFIAGVLYWWLGTLDPAEMWRKLYNDFRLMF
ncbi:MAG: B-box zinc finger protein [Candidatus Sumerlaeaceae bacterium]